MINDYVCYLSYLQLRQEHLSICYVKYGVCIVQYLVISSTVGKKSIL